MGRKKKYEKEKADINISFGVGKHDRTEYDSNSFDGLGGTIAHAFFPPDGRLHFDDDEIWKINLKPNSKSDFYGSSDLLSCAIHEIGHILGLKHSTVDGTIMWPLLQNGLHTLHHDDIDSVRALYGSKRKETPSKDEQNGCVIETGVYIYSGNNVGKLHVENGTEECASQCALTEGCVAWTLDVHQSYCWLKSDDSNKGEAEGWTTGIKECGSNENACFAHSDCPTVLPFCYNGNCAICQECQYCHDGIDGTCGTCGASFPTNEEGSCKDDEGISSRQSYSGL